MTRCSRRPRRGCGHRRCRPTCAGLSGWWAHNRSTPSTCCRSSSCAQARGPRPGGGGGGGAGGGGGGGGGGEGAMGGGGGRGPARCPARDRRLPRRPADG